MPADKVKLEIEQGATFAFTLVRKFSNGTPVDFTGYTARMQIRKAQGAEILTEVSTTNGKITIPVGSDGRIRIKLDPVDTKALRFSRCLFDLLVTGPGDVGQYRLLQGPVEVSPAITQDPGDPRVVRA